MARLAYQFAIHSPQIIVDVVEVSEFPDMIQKYQVRAVPKTVINDRVAFDGALPEPLFLQKFLEAVKLEKLEEKG